MVLKTVDRDTYFNYLCRLKKLVPQQKPHPKDEDWYRLLTVLEAYLDELLDSEEDNTYFLKENGLGNELTGFEKWNDEWYACYPSLGSPRRLRDMFEPTLRMLLNDVDEIAERQILGW